MWLNFRNRNWFNTSDSNMKWLKNQVVAHYETFLKLKTETENERFGLVFAKTGSINSGTWVSLYAAFDKFMIAFRYGNVYHIQACKWKLLERFFSEEEQLWNFYLGISGIISEATRVNEKIWQPCATRSTFAFDSVTSSVIFGCGHWTAHFPFQVVLS